MQETNRGPRQDTMELCLLFWLFSFAHGLEKTVGLDTFVEDVIDTWQIRSPTIIYQDDLPELCRNRDWILCLSIAWDMNEMVQHLIEIYTQRKHDGLIFLGQHGLETILKKLSDDAPLLFSTNYPIFMPTSYETDIKLRLDSNVLFYEEKNVEHFELYDKFTVKGGPIISLEVGKWNKGNGIVLRKSMNRWDRRTNLKGATFVNGVSENPGWADFIKDNNGNLIGTEGYYQDMLFYITDHLNLRIETFELPWGSKQLENGSWTGAIGMLQSQRVDTISSGLGINIQRSYAIDYPIPTNRSPLTLIAAKPKGTSPNTWVYVRVFGFHQWMIFIIALLLMAMGLSFIQILSEDQSHRELRAERQSHINYIFSSSISALSMVCLYTIQLGSHTNSRQMAPRFLTITACLLTLIMFIFYTGDITAEMTSGPRGIPINNFEDVIYHDYKVITMANYYENVLASAKPGSAMLEVYNNNFEKQTELDNSIQGLRKVLEDPDSKTLMFASPDSYIPTNPSEKAITDKTFPLKKLDDTLYSIGTLALQKDSEFHQIFNHYILKALEGGDYKRVYRNHHMDLFVKENFELPEPQPLGVNNVMFCFISLGFGLCLSITLVMIEFLTKKLNKQQDWAKEMNIRENTLQAEGKKRRKGNGRVEGESFKEIE